MKQFFILVLVCTVCFGCVSLKHGEDSYLRIGSQKMEGLSITTTAPDGTVTTVSLDSQEAKSETLMEILKLVRTLVERVPAVP